MAGNTLEFTDKNFQQDVLEAKVPVLVDFWAPWCGPCRMVAPVLEQLVTEYAGRVKVGKVNVDENMQTADRYSIRSIPTLLIFKDGKVADQMVGASSRTTSAGCWTSTCRRPHRSRTGWLDGRTTPRSLTGEPGPGSGAAEPSA